MADALFTINDDDSDQGYDAANDEEIELRLKTLPVSGVDTVVFQVFAPSAFDDSLGITRNPPRASKDAPVLDLEGSTTGQSVTPVAKDGAVTTTLPSTGSHSVIVRCVVNGGMRTLGGRSVVDPRLIHERMIVIRDDDGSRKIIATETTQYEDDGWAPEVGRGADGADGATGPTGPTGPTGAFSGAT